MSKLVQEIEAVDCGNYYLTVREITELAERYGNEVIDNSTEIYKAGFIKGQRAEKARQKKRQSIA